jgi:transcriptional/translational regulatory protein YebC/TACO1
VLWRLLAYFLSIKPNIEFKKAELQRIPTSPVQLNDEQFEKIEKLLDKIEEDDDVQAVFTNIE